MSFKGRAFTAIGVVVLVWCAGFVRDYFDPNTLAHRSMQVQLKLFGSAMYEYHSLTGRWPAKLDDLAQTSLPGKSPIWREAATAMVMLWPQDLKSDPKDNAAVLLAYYPGGLFNRLGRVWVCWGDLRTEHLPDKDLRARLRGKP